MAGSATKHLLEDWIDLRFRCAAQGSAKDATLAVAACVSEGRRCKVPGGTPEYLGIGRNDIEQVNALKHSKCRIDTAGKIVIVCGHTSDEFTARRAEAMNIFQDLSHQFIFMIGLCSIPHTNQSPPTFDESAQGIFLFGIDLSCFTIQ